MRSWTRNMYPQVSIVSEFNELIKLPGTCYVMFGCV